MDTSQTTLATPDQSTPLETMVTDTTEPFCDGGMGALGHPRVWLDMGAEGFVDCGYCGRRFILRHGPYHRGRGGGVAG